MLRAADVEVDVLPVSGSLGADQSLVVVRVHVAEVVGAAASEAWHGVELDGEDGLLVDELLIDNLAVRFVPSPYWWFAGFCGQELIDLRKFQGQAFLGYHRGDALLVIDREWFAPVALAAEDGVAQAEVHLDASQLVCFDEAFCLGNGFLDGEAVEAEALAVVLHALVGTDGRVHDDAFLGVVAFLRDVGTLHQRDDGQAEVLGEGVVATVVGRHSHDGSRAVAGKDVLGNIDGTFVARDGVDAIGAAEDACHGVVYHAFPLGAALDVLDVLIDGLALFWRCHLIDQLAFGSEDEEGDAEHRVGTGGEDGESQRSRGQGAGGKRIALAVGILLLLAPCSLLLFANCYLHFRSFAAAYPVALRFLDALAPVDGVEAVEEALAVGADAQAPLPHLLLLHGIAAALAHAVDDLVVGKHRAELRTPVHHRLAQESQAMLHQQVALSLFVSRPGACQLELLDELLDGLCLLEFLVEVGVEHLLEGPLRPVVVVGCAGAHFAVPVKGEAYLVELFAVAVDVGEGSLLGVLTRLDGVLFGRQSVGIIAHRVEHIEALQPLVACIDVAGDVAQGMADVQSRTAGIGEHVEDIELLAALVLGYLICLAFRPEAVPLLFNLSEIVFFCHIYI